MPLFGSGDSFGENGYCRPALKTKTLNLYSPFLNLGIAQHPWIYNTVIVVLQSPGRALQTDATYR